MTEFERTLETEEERGELVCTHCGRVIEWCSFCDEVGCSDPNCFSCLVIELGESIGEIHEHGG